MNPTRKSFLLSLMFHALMGVSAFFTLTQIHTPPPAVLSIPLHSMMVVSLNQTLPSTKATNPIRETPLITPVPPIEIPRKEPIVPAKTEVAPPEVHPRVIPSNPVTTLPEIPVVSPVQPTVPIHNVPVAEVAPVPVKKEPKINTAAEMESLKASLRTRIKERLHYPASARRRGMEGSVDVRFTLLGNGTIKDISIQNGEAVFHNAVKTAVALSSGIEVPKYLADSLPKEMELTLEFKLNS